MNIEKSLKLPYTKFVKLLKDEAAKEKVRALIKSGREDGFPDDEKIKFSKGVVLTRNLQPTQRQLLIESSIKWAIIGKDGVGLQEILTGRPVEVNGKAIVTLNGKYVIDGHHRWAEAFIMNPNSKIVNLDMQINIEPLEALKIIQLSIAANAGDIPFSSPKGTNLLHISKEAFTTFVKKNVTKKVLEMFVKTDDELAEYLWEHVEMLKKSNAPIKNAPDRVYMPQPSKAPGAIEDLEDGKIDFKKPFAKREKQRIPSWDNFILEYEHINEGSLQNMLDANIIKPIIKNNK